MNPIIAVGVAAASVMIGLMVLRGRRPLIGWLLIAHGACFGVLLTHVGRARAMPRWLPTSS